MLVSDMMNWIMLFHLCSFVSSSSIYGWLLQEHKDATETNVSIASGQWKKEKSFLFEKKMNEEVLDATTADIDVEVWTYPVGTGDATLIRCPRGEVSLIDMGSKSAVMDENDYVIRVWPEVEQGRLKHIFFTHADEDHINYGLKPSNGKYWGLLADITAFDPTGATGTIEIHIGKEDSWNGIGHKRWFLDFIKEYKKFQLSVHDQEWKEPEQQPDERKVYICGKSLYPNIFVQILAADLGGSTAPNADSLVMKLHNGDKKMLFLGDFDSKYTDLYEICDNPDLNCDLKADVVMVPHHGSNTLGNGDPHFYSRVGAKNAIISSNILNQGCKHPKSTTINAFCGNIRPSACVIGYVDQCPYPYKSIGYHAFSMEIDSVTKSLGYGLLPEYNCPEKNIYQTTKINLNDQTLDKKFIKTLLHSKSEPEITEIPFEQVMKESDDFSTDSDCDGDCHCD